MINTRNEGGWKEVAVLLRFCLTQKIGNWNEISVHPHSIYSTRYLQSKTTTPLAFCCWFLEYCTVRAPSLYSSSSLLPLGFLLCLISKRNHHPHTRTFLVLMALQASFSYEVFLSFRGRDTRYGFTGNLYNALRDKGIHTFFDAQELRGGENITPALEKAIKESKIAIVVFSVNYASSSFCLDELATIMECVKGEDRLVLPVFYDVDPCHVRHQIGSYGDAMTKHEKRFKHDKKKLQRWREALRQAADLSGKHFKLERNEYEYAFIQKIVKEISKKISHVTLHTADYLVGLESQVLEVNSLLNNGFDEGVLMVGIYGLGGIGKTTLAQAVYNSIAKQFEASCFLESVREKSSKFGLKHLQETLLSKMLGYKDINLGGVNEGIPIIKQRLHRKKVLLVLDDVDELEQMGALVGGAHWLGSGSRVIITTRDEHLLTSNRIEINYEVKGLSEKEALDLLGWHAFKGGNIDPSYMDILKHAVTYACGLPLALKVIGSNLVGKSIEEWRSELAQYKKFPPAKIQKILEISFQALEECHQKIFLDIACAFNRCYWPKVEHILHACHQDVSLENGISVLVQKSLVKINKFGYVTLHDLIRDMGREIVRQESTKPYERSRLWIPRDVVRVLEDNTGTDNIEIMILDPPTFEELVVVWDGKAFEKMKSLKILIIRHACFSQAVNHLPNSLIVLEWWNYPSSSLPSNFRPTELAILDLRSSRLMSIKFVEKQQFRNFTFLNLGGSEIEQVPDLSNVPNLEKLSFKGCMNLIKVHESVGFLNKLCSLKASNCSKLKSFPAVMLPSLKELDFSGCTSIEHVPDLSGVPNLENLSFHGCENLTKVHESVGFLMKLRCLWAMDCSKLKSFPALMLPSLKRLELSGCSSLEKFPKILGRMEGITIIDWKNTLIQELPSSIANLSNLAILSMNFSGMLRLPNSIYTLPYLKYLHIWGHGGLQLPKQEEDEGKGSSMVSTSVESVRLTRCHMPDEPIPILLAWFCNVVKLHLSGNDFTILPGSIKKLCSLRELTLNNCKKLREIRGIPPNIKTLTAANCISLTPSCRSMLLSEEYHSSNGYRSFHLPGSSIPKWFEHRNTDSISFWVRNNIPSVSVCVVLGSDASGYTMIWPEVIINGNRPNCVGSSSTGGLIHVADHITIVDIKSLLAGDKLLSENEWNHVEFRVWRNNSTRPCTPPMKKFGIHVHKHESNTENVRFIEPRGDLDPSCGKPPTKRKRSALLAGLDDEPISEMNLDSDLVMTRLADTYSEGAAGPSSGVKQEIPQNPNEAFHHEEEEEAGEEEEEEGGNDDHKNTTFVPGPLLHLRDLIERDKEDESLRTWKENDRDTRYGKVYKRRRGSRAE